ncbi:MAG TPA: TolC family protein [Paucimonas sp.]|nr:TolC family protein [Paucimonas sp.]
MTSPVSPASEAPIMRGVRTVEPATSLTLAAALSLAMQTNAGLAAARHELDAVDAAVRQAGTLPNPTLDMTAEDRRRETRETAIQLSLPLEWGGKRSARIAAAEHERAATAAELQAKHAEVRAAVIAAFFEVLIAQERLRLAEEAALLARRGADAAARRVTAGKVSPVEETKARVAESSVRLELQHAKLELAMARKRLAATWGNPAPRFERAEGQAEALPALPDPAALTQRLPQAPAIVRARAERDRREALARLESRRRIPDLTVSLGVKRSEELGRNRAIVGLSLPLPIFDQNRGNLLEARRRADKAREELSSAELLLDQEVHQAIGRLTLARQEVEVLQNDIVPAARQAMEAAAKGFEYGKFSFLDMLDAQRTLLAARSQYLRALSDAHRAGAEIDRLLGTVPYATTP